MWKAYRPNQDQLSDRPLQQSSVYANAVLAIGGKVAVHHTEGIDVLALERGPFRLALRCPADAERLRCMARGKAFIALCENPIPMGGVLPVSAARQTALWNLAPSPDALRQNLNQKWRNRLYRAQEHVTPPSRGGAKILAQLLTLEMAQRAERGYRALPAALTQAIPFSCLSLWHWSPGGSLHAAMAFVRHGSWATYHLGFASAQARAAHIHQHLLWEAALELRAEGVTTLDLGDLNPSQTAGIARFKLGTGARAHPLGRALWVMPRVGFPVMRGAFPARER